MRFFAPNQLCHGAEVKKQSWTSPIILRVGMNCHRISFHFRARLASTLCKGMTSRGIAIMGRTETFTYFGKRSDPWRCRPMGLEGLDTCV